MLVTAVLETLVVRDAAVFECVVDPRIELVVLVAELPLAAKEEALGALFVEEALVNGGREALERPVVAEAVFNEGRLGVVAVNKASV